MSLTRGDMWHEVGPGEKEIEREKHETERARARAQALEYGKSLSCQLSTIVGDN